MSCGVGGRHGSDPTLLWLWCRLAAIAPIRPLAWELPYAVGVAQKSKKKKKKVYHILLIHSSVDGHLSCFHVWAIVDSAAMLQNRNRQT